MALDQGTDTPAPGETIRIREGQRGLDLTEPGISDPAISDFGNSLRPNQAGAADGTAEWFGYEHSPAKSPVR